jgi:hypothetical protein
MNPTTASRARRQPIGPRIRTVRPTATTRYYILEDRETGERETERSFETERAAIQYVLRNYGEGA